jgi:hypothetical protein
VYALAVILVGWVFFRSPTPDFALDFLRRLAGDMTGYRVLPFELTSPLPFIEPTFLLALAFGLIFCLPLGDWFQKIFAGIFEGSRLKYLPLQVLNDAGLVLLFLASLASTASAVFQPNIYGTF